MKLTTKSRYAVTAIMQVAVNSQNTEKPIPTKLAEISSNHDIPLNYLEQIFAKLRQASVVNAVKGPGGGYVLNIRANDLKIMDIIKAVDENVKMTICGGGKYCTKSGLKCNTHDLWKGLSAKIREYLSSISIEDVINNNLKIDA